MIVGMHFSGFLQHGRACTARAFLAAGVPAALIAALLSGCGTPRPAPPAPLPAVRHAEPPTDAGLPASAARALAQRFPYMRAIGHGAGHLQVDDADDLA